MKNTSLPHPFFRPHNHSENKISQILKKSHETLFNLSIRPTTFPLRRSHSLSHALTKTPHDPPHSQTTTVHQPHSDSLNNRHHRTVPSAIRQSTTAFVLHQQRSSPSLCVDLAKPSPRSLGFCCVLFCFSGTDLVFSPNPNHRSTSFKHSLADDESDLPQSPSTTLLVSESWPRTIFIFSGNNKYETRSRRYHL